MKLLQHRGKDGFGISGILDNGKIENIRIYYYKKTDTLNRFIVEIKTKKIDQ